MLKRVKLVPVAVLVCTLTAVFLLPAADPPALKVDGAQAKAFVEILSTDAMQGRQSCTEGYRKAAEWAAGKFKEFGLKPAGVKGTYFQTVPIRSFHWNEGMPSFSVGDRAFLLDDGDFAVNQVSTAKTEVKAQVVFAGYGISAPKKGLDEYAGLDVKDKVVLVFRGSPSKIPRQRVMLAAETQPKPGNVDWTQETKVSLKIKTAYDKGAAAILLFDPDSGQRDGRSHRSYGMARAPADFEPERPFLCVSIQERVFRAIMKQDPQESPRGLGRRMLTLRRAINEKKSQSRATGVTVQMKGYEVSTAHNEKNGNNTARNVLAKIEGTDPALKGEYVMLGGHLDHVGIRNGYVYNGADDNASGSAVVLEVARVLGSAGYKPKRTVIFCLWCGEEMGLIGSSYFGDNPCDGVTMDRVAAYFNLDMVGLGENFSAHGALNFPDIWEVIIRGQDPGLMKRIKPGIGRTGGSDHTPFIKRGIEAVFLMSRDGGGHPDYHQPEDDTGKISAPLLGMAAQFVVKGVTNLADETRVNLLIEGRKRMYEALWMEVRNFNPRVSGSLWSQVAVKAKDKEALHKEIIAAAMAVVRKAKVSGPQPTGKRSLTRGFNQLKVFQGDIDLLLLASEFYGAGRMDIQEEDGVWIKEGRVTEQGKALVAALEKAGIAIHLLSPKAALLEDMLNMTSRPFVVTGRFSIPEKLVEAVNRKNVLIGVDLDAKKVDAFIQAVESRKEALGQRQNLFAFMTAGKGLQDAKQSLYMGLMKKGWAHNEICGTRREGGGLLRCNFKILGGK